MISEYAKKFKEDFLLQTTDCPVSFELIDYLECNDLKKGMDCLEIIPGSSFVFLTYQKEYIVDPTISSFTIVDETGFSKIYPFDFTHTMPLLIKPVITIMGTDIDDIVALEEYFCNKYAFPRVLEVLIPEIGTIQCTLVRDPENEIARSEDSMGEIHYLQSCVFLGLSYGVEYVQSFSAAQVAFDKEIKEDVFKRLFALRKWEKAYKGILPARCFVEEDYALSETDKTIYEKMEKIKQLGDEIVSNTKVVPEKLSCLYYLQIINEKWNSMALGLDFYIKFYSNDVVDTVWLLLEQERIAQEEKEQQDLEEKAKKEIEKERIELIHKAQGDRRVNLLIDPVVNCFKTQLMPSFSFKVFGGSTQWKAYRWDNDQSPSIEIVAQIDYRTDLNRFSLENGKGEKVFYNSNPLAYPVMIGYRAVIFGTVEEIDEIKAQMYKHYSAEKTIKAPILSKYYPGHKYYITLNIDQDELIQYENRERPIRFLSQSDKSRMTSTVPFSAHSNAIIAEEYNEDDQIALNEQLQYRMLQQAQYCLEMSQKMYGLVEPMRWSVKPLFKKEAAVSVAMKGRDYKTIKQQYEQKQPIDVRAFERYYNEIVKVYPYMLNRLYRNWTYEQLENEVIRMAEAYRKRWMELSDLLGIPNDYVRNGLQIAVRSKGLDYFIKRMEEVNHSFGEYVLVQDILEPCEDELARQEIRRIQFEEARKEIRAEHRSDLKDVAKTAAGVYIGNKLSNRNPSQAPKTHKYATCSPTCPRYKQDWQRGRCQLDPHTCGNGILYG